MSYENSPENITFTRTAPPAWLLQMWREIDDKTGAAESGGAGDR